MIINICFHSWDTYFDHQSFNYLSSFPKLFVMKQLELCGVGIIFTLSEEEQQAFYKINIH